MTPVEVMVYNLCSDKKVREEILNEIEEKLSLAPKNDHIEIDICLAALKKRGLIIC